MSQKRREAGVLLHPTSLPGPHGVGELGPEAFRFVDFLEKAGQTLWQVLPLGPTGYGDSPYASFSTFAGNPRLRHQYNRCSPTRGVNDNVFEYKRHYTFSMDKLAAMTKI